MLKKIIEKMATLYEPQTMENNSYSRATTPDQLIASALIQSFAKNFEDWQIQGRDFEAGYEVKSFKHKGYNRFRLNRVTTYRSDASFHDGKLKLYNFKLQISIVFRTEIARFEKAKDAGGYSFTPLIEHIEVNHQKLDGTLTDQVVAAYVDMNTAAVKAKEVADAARAKMEANEAKWNLAEKLLGMKRNEQGALVPIQKVEE